MTSCCHPHQMPWSGATGAIARCKRVSTGCGRKSRSVRVLRWICGVKLKPKAVNKPLPYFIVHELDKPGALATVSTIPTLSAADDVQQRWCRSGHQSVCCSRGTHSVDGPVPCHHSHA